jgi:hypothetical protein
LDHRLNSKFIAGCDVGKEVCIFCNMRVEIKIWLCGVAFGHQTVTMEKTLMTHIPTSSVRMGWHKSCNMPPVVADL